MTVAPGTSPTAETPGHSGLPGHPRADTLLGDPAIRRIRTRHILDAKRRGERWAMLTSYDQYTAALFDSVGMKSPSLRLLNRAPA